MKKRYALVIILLLILFSIFAIAHYTFESYNLWGTYSAGNEPAKDNIYIVLKNKHFTIYNQEKILENGLFKKLNLNNKSNIYKLVTNDNTKVGYIVHDRNYIILLDFRSIDVSLKKISTSAIYLNYELEQKHPKG